MLHFLKECTQFHAFSVRFIILGEDVEHELELGEECSEWQSPLALVVQVVADAFRFGDPTRRVAFTLKVTRQCLHVLPPVLLLPQTLDPLFGSLALNTCGNQVVNLTCVRFKRNPIQRCTSYALLGEGLVAFSDGLIVITDDIRERDARYTWNCRQHVLESVLPIREVSFTLELPWRRFSSDGG